MVLAPKCLMHVKVLTALSNVSHLFVCVWILYPAIIIYVCLISIGVSTCTLVGLIMVCGGCGLGSERSFALTTAVCPKPPGATATAHGYVPICPITLPPFLV